MANTFYLHPEEAEKVFGPEYEDELKKINDCPGGILKGLSESIARVLDSEDPEGYSSDLAPWEKRLVEDGVGISGSSLPANDPVNHPKHYNSYNDIEIIQLTEQLNFNRGSAIKYISRAGLKAVETEIQDLEKAEFHIRREIERLKINAKREN